MIQPKIKRDLANNIVNKEILELEQKEEISIEKNKNKVVAFRLSSSFLHFIDVSIHKKKLYASLSELVRIALFDLMDYIINKDEIEQDESIEFKLLDLRDSARKLNDIESYKNRKNACSKLPKTLFTITDKVWESRKHIFKDRSDFIITAIYFMKVNDEKIENRFGGLLQ